MNDQMLQHKLVTLEDGKVIVMTALPMASMDVVVSDNPIASETDVLMTDATAKQLMTQAAAGELDVNTLINQQGEQ